MDFKAARQAMVDCQLSTNNVVSKKVLGAMSEIPREEFLPEHKRAFAYLDEDIEICEGRYLLEPMVIGRMVQAADPQEQDIALDIGCGSGYSAAVLSAMVETVISVESYDKLRDHAQKTWSRLGLCNIVELSGQKEDVIVENAPYDVIFINGAVQSIPQGLIAQLKEETGRMVCVLREDAKAAGQAVLVQKFAGGHVSVVPLFDANVPYLSDFAPKNTFSF